MKKTTAKEFKELMIDVYGKCDFDMIINQLSLLESMLSNDCFKRGLDAIGEEYYERSDKMYDYLNKREF